jgi:hypothetical protein
VRALKAANRRCSVVDPAGGSRPIWRATDMPSGTATLPTIRPSSTRTRSIPSSSTRAPVGSTPHSGPVIVAVAVQCTAARPSSATVERTVTAKSGNAVNSSSK